MTLIAAWVGVDNKKEGRKISSIYFAADSRFSWGDAGSAPKYDEGMKVFCSLQHPYIFAYCVPNNNTPEQSSLVKLSDV